MFSWRTAGQALTTVRDLYLTSSGWYFILKPKAEGEQEEPRPVVGYMSQMAFFRKGRDWWNGGGQGGWNQVRGDLQITPLVPVKDAEGNDTPERVGGYLRGTFLNSESRNPITADLRVYRTDYKRSLMSRASNLDLGQANKSAVVHNSDKAYVVSGPEVNGFFRRLKDLEFFPFTRTMRAFNGSAPGAPDYSSSAGYSFNSDAQKLRGQSISNAYDRAMSHPAGCWLFWHSGKLAHWFAGGDGETPTGVDMPLPAVSVTPPRPDPIPDPNNPVPPEKAPLQPNTIYIEQVWPIALIGDQALLTVITVELRPNPNYDAQLGSRYLLYMRAHSVRMKAGAIVSSTVTGYAGRDWIVSDPQPQPTDFNYYPAYGKYEPGPLQAGGTIITAGMGTTNGEYLIEVPWDRPLAQQPQQPYYLVEVAEKFWLKLTLEGTGATSIRWFWSKDKGGSWTPFPSSFHTSGAIDFLAGAGQSAVRKDLQFTGPVRRNMKAKEVTL